MSGIAGIFYFDGRTVTSRLLRKMMASLAHRGSDGSRVWCGGPAGLANCTFATTLESRSSQQPLVDAAGSLVIAADARIDNRPELAALLGLAANEARNPDEYYILKAYEKWGQDCAARLLGDFAFAIWDTRRHQLFCARDAFGVKPFYYYTSANKFIFASEIKAILSLDEISLEINELCLFDYLIDDRNDKENTFFRGIYRLPPANFLSVQPGKRQTCPYWLLTPAKEVRFNDQDEYAGRFQELFTQAIQVRLRSSLPIGCALSGGLDSSSIACIARNLLAESRSTPLDTFTAVFSGLSDQELSLIDERNFVEIVLGAGGFQPHYVDMGLIGPLNDVERTLHILDEPVSAPTLSMHHGLYKAASSQGLGIYLEGIDGDQVVSHGYEYFIDLARHLRWGTWIRKVQELSMRSGQPQSEIIKHYTLQMLIPPPIYRIMQNLRRRRGMDGSLEYLSADFTHQNSIKARIQEYNQRNNRLPHSARQAHFLDLSSGTVPLSFEVLDKIAANCNIEIRYPFYDQRVVEYCLAIPAEQKLSAGWTRFTFRESLAGIVPEEIRWRGSKADFRPFFKSGMMKFSKPLLEQVISNESAYIEPYLDIARLRTLQRRFASGESCSTGEVEILYRAALLSKWIERLSTLQFSTKLVKKHWI